MSLSVGACEREITPTDSQFLFGYPHVKRYSTGVHDPLLCSALVIEDHDHNIAAFVACDIIFVDRILVASARKRITEACGVHGESVMISATHTHSGPLTVDHVSNERDPVVPKADPAYRRLLEDAIVEAVCEAFASRESAEIGLAVADGTGVGTNRRDPDGPRDLEVPVLLARRVETGEPIACMVVCSMHPTVLHEDSTLVSADFPGFARSYLKKNQLKDATPVLYHTGPAGNQSPRHVTRENTFSEARRLGEILGRAIESVIPSIEYASELPVSIAKKRLSLAPREFPPVAEAKRALEAAESKLASLRESDASKTEIRTAEVDWFGAEETLTLAAAAEAGRVAQAVDRCLPAEVMVVSVGSWNFVGMPGELFIEYAIELKRRCPGSFVISLANGELQGYIVTEEAAALGGYEASNALIHHSAGNAMVDAAATLIGCS